METAWACGARCIARVLLLNAWWGGGCDSFAMLIIWLYSGLRPSWFALARAVGLGFQPVWPTVSILSNRCIYPRRIDHPLSFTAVCWHAPNAHIREWPYFEMCLEVVGSDRGHRVARVFCRQRMTGVCRVSKLHAIYKVHTHTHTETCEQQESCK